MGKLIYGGGLGATSFDIPDELLVGVEGALSAFVRHAQTFEISLRGEDPDSILFTLYVTPGVPLHLKYEQPTKITDEAIEDAKALRGGLKEGVLILTGFTTNPEE